MFCFMAEKICNNTSRVSARQPRQQAQSCGWDGVVIRLCIPHQDHIEHRFSLINEPSWSAYRLDQHCVPFMPCLLFPCRRPCRGGSALCAIMWEREKETKGASEICHNDYLNSLVYWKWLNPRLRYSQEQEGRERKSLSPWGNSLHHQMPWLPIPFWVSLSS